MKQMSFSMTTEQIKRRDKDVTRRLGWDSLKVGELVQAVEKGQGLKKGEHPVKLCVIRVKDKRKEPLCEIYNEKDGCKREGFPELTPDKFVDMFCKANQPCQPRWPVNRIEFEYVD